MSEKEIPLTRGMAVIVDADDYEMLSQHKWNSMRGGRSKDRYYAARWDRTGEKPVLIMMHRVITKAQPGQVVDHIDRNTMNNRKENLRLCTPQMNCWNRPPEKNKKHSQFKGVTKSDNSWLAQCQGKSIGFFKTEIEAARAYNEKAKAVFGEYAYLNEID